MSTQRLRVLAVSAFVIFQRNTRVSRRILKVGTDNTVMLKQARLTMGENPPPPGTNIHVLPDGYHISRRCDWIMYAVEAEYIDAVVKKYGPGKIG